MMMVEITDDTKRKLPDGWRWVKLPNAVTRFNPHLRKLKTSEYQKNGSFPIIDQGQQEIVGYTDDRSCIIEAPLPLVVFGDHTKISKHIDRPFALGADGVVLLSTKKNVDSMFFYYWLSQVYLRELGYARHFSVLKNKSVPLPPLPEQRRIVGVLREQMAEVEKARTAAQARLEAAKALPAAFIRETLQNGRKSRHLLGDCLVEVKNGVGVNWSKYPVLGATRDGLAPAKEPVGKTPERYKLADPVTVFYNPMRILLGSIAMVDEGDEPGITSPDYVVVKGRAGILDTRWFYYWFRSSEGAHLIDSLSRGAVRERILFNRLAAGKIEIPDYETQLYASTRTKQVRPIVESITKELENINTLPAALLRRAFNGDI